MIMCSDAFARVIAGGQAHLTPYVQGLAFAMTTLALMLFCLGVMAHQRGMMTGAFKMSMVAGFYLLVIGQAQPIGEGIILNPAVGW